MSPSIIEFPLPTKPSEAIRLGCVEYPIQAFGDYFDNDGGACVFGAMAAGWRLDVGVVQGYFEQLAGLNRGIGGAPTVTRLPRCPECVGRPGWEATFAWPAHMNDEHRWSRERCADLLAEVGL